MHGIVSGVHVSNLPGLIGLFGLWIILFEGTHLLLSLSRNEPLIGWAVGPLGFTPLYLREPSTFYILLNVFLPALVSGLVLYIGLFTSIAPISLPHDILLEIIVIAAGILLPSPGGGRHPPARPPHPLWGGGPYPAQHPEPALKLGHHPFHALWLLLPARTIWLQPRRSAALALISHYIWNGGYYGKRTCCRNT